MKKICFITNLEKDSDFKYTDKLINSIKNENCIIVAQAVFEAENGFNKSINEIDKMFNESDFAVVLGGDGTILSVAKRACIYDTPILGINLGTLGYLADVEKQDSVKALKKLISGNFTIEKRMMLEAFVEGKKIENNKGLALNDVCINSGFFSRMIEIGVKVNGFFMNSCRADGIIVSSPTGSTAYNLSAGGPILKPDTKLIAITNVCPHALYMRPYVISGNDTVDIFVQAGEKGVFLMLDGQKIFELKKECHITVKKSDYYTKIVKTTELSFYDILRRKMVEVRF